MAGAETPLGALKVTRGKIKSLGWRFRDVAWGQWELLREGAADGRGSSKNATAQLSGLHQGLVVVRGSAPQAVGMEGCARQA